MGTELEVTVQCDPLRADALYDCRIEALSVEQTGAIRVKITVEGQLQPADSEWLAPYLTAMLATMTMSQATAQTLYDRLSELGFRYSGAHLWRPSFVKRDIQVEPRVLDDTACEDRQLYGSSMAEWFVESSDEHA